MKTRYSDVVKRAADSIASLTHRGSLGLELSIETRLQQLYDAGVSAGMRKAKEDANKSTSPTTLKMH